MMVNKTYQTVCIAQSGCEELGTFKIFSQETSVFHWTDKSKSLEVNVTLNDHEYSGNFRIDGIGELYIRLKNSREGDSSILNVSISEEQNSFFIVISDVSDAPPYRIENQTKTRFRVEQINSRADDFDRLHPYQSIPFAWSYPMEEKRVSISLCTLTSEE
jgi:hypothetical protein